MRLMRVVLFLVCAAVPSIAQTHFTFTSNTGVNAIVGIPASINPTIAGTPIAVGDEIGAFTPAGLCVGAKAWTGSNIALTVWGDNSITTAVDGIKAGETILYRFWQKSTGSEFATVTVTYSLGDGIFAADGLYTLASLLTTTLPPSVPTLTAPANNATNIATTPTLSWQAAANATSYNIELSSDSLFTSLVIQSSVTATSKTAPTLSNNATYFWRVQSVNTGGVSAWSTVFRFSTPLVPPGAPALQSPISGAVDVTTVPTLAWGPGVNATSYTLQLALDPLFTISVNQWTQTALSKTMTLLTGGTTYYWRVQSVNKAGVSDWSTVFSFQTTSGAIPPVPTLTYPADRAVNMPADVTLQWGAVAGATTYLLDVSTDSTFDTYIDRSFQSGTSKMLYPLLSIGTTYYWRVRSENGGAVSNFTAVRRFTVSTSITGVRNEAAVPDRFVLEQNYPNPFNPSTTVRFTIPEGTVGSMSLRVYDVLGCEVAELVNGPASAGTHVAVWNAAGAASGMYVCRLTAGKLSASTTMFLAK